MLCRLLLTCTNALVYRYVGCLVCQCTKNLITTSFQESARIVCLPVKVHWKLLRHLGNMADEDLDIALPRIRPDVFLLVVSRLSTYVGNNRLTERSVQIIRKRLPNLTRLNIRTLLPLYREKQHRRQWRSLYRHHEEPD